MSLLDSVQIIPRTRHADGRGWLLKVLDGAEAHLPDETGECYLTLAHPGQLRGNHYHRETAEWFTVVEGEAELVIADPATGEERRLVCAAAEPRTIYVPAGIGHVFVNAPDAERSMLLVAYADRRYDPVDTIPMRVR